MATSKLVKQMKKSLRHLWKSFFNIEHSVVDRYTKIEDTFVKPILQKKAKQQPKPKNGCCRNRHSGKADEQCI